MAYSCLTLMELGTELLTTDERFRGEIRQLIDDGADASALAEAFAQMLNGDDATLFQEEFEELPLWTWHTMAQHWAIAERAGKRFVLRSVPPRRVLDSARKNRVELNIAMEEDAVVLELSHVPGHHSTWYRPEAISA